MHKGSKGSCHQLLFDLEAMKTILVFVSMMAILANAKYTKFNNHVDFKPTGPIVKSGM